MVAPRFLRRTSDIAALRTMNANGDSTVSTGMAHTRERLAPAAPFFSDRVEVVPVKLRARALAFGFIALVGTAAPAFAHCPSSSPRPGEKVVRCETTAPVEVVDRARRYLARQSSEPMQAERFSLLPRKTSVDRRINCEGEAVTYSLTFEYAPFRLLGSDRPWYELLVPADPACDVVGDVRLRSGSGEVLDPTITRQEAISIARRDGGAPAGVKVAEARIHRSSDDGWEWRIDFGDCAVETVAVDAVSGIVRLGMPGANPFAPKSIGRYPFVASDERAASIRKKYHDVMPGMIVSGVKLLLGEPDEVRPLYEADVEGGKLLGHTFSYVLRRMKEDGSAAEKNEELVRVSFDLSGKVTRVDYWGERPSSDRS